MATPADEPKDVLDFKFRSIRKVRLHDETEIGEIPKEPTQKLAVANTLGRIFAGKNYLKHMPCSSTGHKMFCDSQCNFLSQT